MKNEDKKVGIIVLHWNLIEYTRKCLDSVLGLEYGNKAIYCIDNHSTNGSVEELENTYKGKVTFIKLQSNLGYAGGNNAGIKKALADQCQSVFILNNDIILDKNCLNILAHELESNYDIGVVLPLVYLGVTGRTIGSFGGSINWRLGEPRLNYHLEDDSGELSKRVVEFAPGSALLVSREAIQKAGDIPEDYFMYSEDIEWSENIKKAGFKIIAIPSAKVWHDESASAGPNSAFKCFYYARNSLRFIKRNRFGFKRFQTMFGFHWKTLKMVIKFLLQGNFGYVSALVLGFIAYYKGETGPSKKFYQP